MMTKSPRTSDEKQGLLVSSPEKGLVEKACQKEPPPYGSATGKKECEQEEHHLFLKSGRRLYCLDVARIMCVALVAVNHGGTTWSDQFGLWNEMYVQQWVLQWLFIICGMSFAMSHRNSSGYLVRLGCYFIIGAFTNWCAWAIAGKDWRSQPWNVVFQFWFIIGVMMYICCLTPLKHYLQRISARGPSLPLDQELGLAHGLAVICLALVAIHYSIKFALAPLCEWALGRAMMQLHSVAGAGGQFWGLPKNLAQANKFVEELLGYVQVSIGSMVILWLFPRVSNRLPLTNWLVLLNVYAFRCFVVRGQFARVIDGFDFTMIGLANYYLGLSYRRTIGKYMVRYWFVMLFVFALLIPPGTFGRFDEHTMHDLSFRIRYHVVELCMTVLLLCAAERIVDGGIFTEDRLAWLSWWSLYVFLFHKFIHIVVPSPLNWLVLLLLAPLCWAIHGGSDKAEGQSAKEDVSKQDNQIIDKCHLQDQQADVESAREEPESEQGHPAP